MTENNQEDFVIIQNQHPLSSTMPIHAMAFVENDLVGDYTELENRQRNWNVKIGKMSFKIALETDPVKAQKALLAMQEDCQNPPKWNATMRYAAQAMMYRAMLVSAPVGAMADVGVTLYNTIDNVLTSIRYKDNKKDSTSKTGAAIDCLEQHITQAFHDRLDEVVSLRKPDAPRRKRAEKQIRVYNKNSVQLNELRFVTSDDARYKDYAFASAQAEWAVTIGGILKTDKIYIEIDPDEALGHVHDMMETYETAHDDDKITFAAQLSIYKNMLRDYAPEKDLPADASHDTLTGATCELQKMIRTDGGVAQEFFSVVQTYVRGQFDRNNANYVPGIGAIYTGP